jgi:Zn-dependent protease
MDPSTSGHIKELVVWYLVFVFSTTCHEAAHAFMAKRGGDPTAHAEGHVSLDPLPHIRRSPAGMVFIPILSFVLSGWMIGWASVPLNPEWARRYPGRASLMALAGPAANLFLALLAFGLLRGLLAGGVLVQNHGGGFFDLVTAPSSQGLSLLDAAARALSVLLGLNVVLFLFNLIPLPPLDGAAAVEGALPRAAGSFYARMRELPMAELLGLLVAWRVFPVVSEPALELAARLLFA